MNQITSNIVYSTIIDHYFQQYLQLVCSKDLALKSKHRSHFSCEIDGDQEIYNFRTIYSVVVHLAKVCKQWRDLLVRKRYPKCFVERGDLVHFIATNQRHNYMFRIDSFAWTDVDGLTSDGVDKQQLYDLVSLDRPCDSYSLEQVQAAVSLVHDNTFVFNSVNEVAHYEHLEQVLSMCFADIKNNNGNTMLKRIATRYIDGPRVAQIIQRLLNKYETIDELYLLGIARLPYDGRDGSFCVPSHVQIKKMWIRDFSDYITLDAFQHCTSLQCLSVDFDIFNVSSIIHHPSLTSLAVSTSTLDKNDVIQYLNTNKTTTQLYIEFSDIENNNTKHPISNTTLKKLEVVSKSSSILHLLELWNTDSAIEEFKMKFALSPHIFSKHPNIRHLDVNTIIKIPNQDFHFPFLNNLVSLKLKYYGDKLPSWMDQLFGRVDQNRCNKGGPLNPVLKRIVDNGSSPQKDSNNSNKNIQPNEYYSTPRSKGRALHYQSLLVDYERDGDIPPFSPVDFLQNNNSNNSNNENLTPNLTSLSIDFYPDWNWEFIQLRPNITSFNIYLPSFLTNISQIHTFLNYNPNLNQFSLSNLHDQVTFDLVKQEIADFILFETNLTSFYIGKDNRDFYNLFQ
ncbi:hypothetical protein CYY_008616 [Polysphondylium violaceum]|uniref:Uncharacterized protein n=1 Tax=Polysphondylium violaceum TaxID=133409 RepID=A0A8J4PMQ0_9MYCE|nr:hypothetical protein CYY_008616 [Polysphondylium violaceum]